MALSYGSAAEIPMQGAVFNLGATMADAQKLQEGDIALQEERAMLPYKLQQAQQGSELSQDQYGNARMAEIAMQANAAADPAQASTIWDQGMQRLAGEGVSNASQYVGHYRKDLAQNVYDTFSGKGTANAGPPGPDPVILYRTMSALPADKLQQIVNNQNQVINGFNNVKDAAGLRNEIGVLQKAGIDVGPFLAGMDLNDDSPAGFARNYQAVTGLVNRLVPYRDTAAQILAEQTTGAPNVGPSYMSGAGGKGRVPPGWKIQGYNAQGETVFYNPLDPTQTMVGDTPVTNRPLAPRTPAAIQTFTYKFQFARDNLGMSDQDAADWANGRKSIEIPDEKRREFAERQSEQDLRDAQNAAFNGGTDADIAAVSGKNEAAWKKADYDRIYNSLGNGPPPSGGAQGAATPPGTKPKYSPMQIKGIQQQARDAVKIKHKDRAAVIATLKKAGVPVPPDL